MSLSQNGLAEAVQKSRKQIKERKNRSKKIRGVKKNACEYQLWIVWRPTGLHCDCMAARPVLLIAGGCSRHPSIASGMHWVPLRGLSLSSNICTRVWFRALLLV